MSLLQLPWAEWFDEAHGFVAGATLLPDVFSEKEDAAGTLIRSMRKTLAKFDVLYWADLDELLKVPPPPHDPNDPVQRWVMLAAGYWLAALEFGQDDEDSSRPPFRAYFAELTDLRSVEEIATERDAIWEMQVAFLADRLPRARAILERSRALGAVEAAISRRWARSLFLHLCCRPPAMSSYADWAESRLDGPLSLQAMNWWSITGPESHILLPPASLQRTDLEPLLEATAAFERAQALGGALDPRERAMLGWCYYSRGSLLDQPHDFRLSAEAGEAWYWGAFEGSKLDTGLNDPDIDWIVWYQPYGSIVAAWERSGDLERARRFAQHWRDKHPDDDFARQWLGRVLIALGQYADGAAELVTSFRGLPKHSDWRADVITQLGFEVLNVDSVARVIRQAIGRNDRDATLVRRVLALEWANFGRLEKEAQDAWVEGLLIMTVLSAGVGNAGWTAAGSMFANALEQQIRISVFEAFASTPPKTPPQPPSGQPERSVDERFVSFIRRRGGTVTLSEMLRILASEPGRQQPEGESARLRLELTQWASRKKNTLRSKVVKCERNGNLQKLKDIRDPAVHTEIDEGQLHQLHDLCRELLGDAVN